MPFIVTRSMMPRQPVLAPPGSWMTAGAAPRRERIMEDGALEVGADAVHLVDERDARHLVVVGLAPDGLGLRLDTGDGVEHRHRAVEHAEAPLDLGGEVT